MELYKKVDETVEPATQSGSHIDDLINNVPDAL
jgi:hypothetical protein